MVKRGFSPSAASFTRSSVVLSCAVKKNFALEAEVSRLRHHVSILSQRLHRNEKELSTLRASVPDAPVPTVILPSSPSSSVASVTTVVSVVGGGFDPDCQGWAEELHRGNVAPAVIPSSRPPFVVVCGVGGPSSDSRWDEAEVAPSVTGSVEEGSVAESVAMAPLVVAEEVPEPPGAEPLAGGDRASCGPVGMVVEGGGSSSAASPPPSCPSRRRKSKKRRVRLDQSSPTPLVPESESSSSPPRMRIRTGGSATLAPPVQPEGAWGGRGTFGCERCFDTCVMSPGAGFVRVSPCGGY